MKTVKGVKFDVGHFCIECSMRRVDRVEAHHLRHLHSTVGRLAAVIHRLLGVERVLVLAKSKRQRLKGKMAIMAKGQRAKAKG